MRAAWALLLLAGCAGPSPDSVEPLRVPDPVFYETHVQVVVGYGCGSLDCHGDPAQPLRIYAVDGLRLRAELRTMDLSPEEAEANALAFGAIDPQAVSADAHLAIVKPLAERAGGLPHVGGDVWLDRADDGHECLRGWLAGTLEESLQSTCARASAAIDPR